MSDAKFPVKDMYNDFLKKQESLQETIKYGKDEIEKVLTDSLSKKDKTLKIYDFAVDNVERVRNGIDEKIKFINDIIPQLIDNANKNRTSLQEVNNILDEFMKKINEAKIATLQELMREESKRIFSKKIESSPLPIKTVFRKTYGGNKKKLNKTVKNKTKKCNK